MIAFSMHIPWILHSNPLAAGPVDSTIHELYHSPYAEDRENARKNEEYYVNHHSAQRNQILYLSESLSKIV